MPTELKLPFGMKDGKLVQISEVERGLKCGCQCPACNHPLVARKGNKTVHHFAHYQNANCEHALETSFHLAAKKVIEETGYFVLPEVVNDIFYSRQNIFAPTSKLYFDNIYLEKRYDDFVPDIILEKDNKQLCIEIYVTHKIDESKKEKIVKSNISTIEVDLSKIERGLDFNHLREKVVDSIANKNWIYNKKREKVRKQILSNSIKRKIISRKLMQHVDDCPLPARIWQGKAYANFFDDCLGCEFFTGGDDSGEKDIMYCIGHKKEEEIQKLLRQF
ncbi:MAG TPA: hypothetical protein DHV28_12515 [Ignavibacteriales bacterium]|nr:hypothetical protein [Ignavibacteriales bacterium]